MSPNLSISKFPDLSHRIPWASQEIFLGVSSVFPRNLIANEWLNPEHVTKEDTRCHKYVCSSWPTFSLVALLGALLLGGGEGCEAFSSRWHMEIISRYHLKHPWLILRTSIFMRNHVKIIKNHDLGKSSGIILEHSWTLLSVPSDSHTSSKASFIDLMHIDFHVRKPGSGRESMKNLS